MKIFLYLQKFKKTFYERVFISLSSYLTALEFMNLFLSILNLLAAANLELGDLS